MPPGGKSLDSSQGHGGNTFPRNKLGTCNFVIPSSATKQLPGEMLPQACGDPKVGLCPLCLWGSLLSMKHSKPLRAYLKLGTHFLGLVLSQMLPFYKVSTDSGLARGEQDASCDLWNLSPAPPVSSKLSLSNHVETGWDFKGSFDFPFELAEKKKKNHKRGRMRPYLVC